MTSGFHGRMTKEQGIHGIISYEYADSTERLAAGPFTINDLNKLAYQIDTGEIFMLTDYSGPTWSLFLTLGVGSAVTSVFGRGGNVVAESGDYDSDQIDNASGVFGISLSDALDYLDGYIQSVSDGFDNHILDTNNPHDTSIANIGPGTLAQLNAAISDATLDDVSGARTPVAHSLSHESGGLDEIDGYNISIVYVPLNYPTPINDVIGEHLSKIDDALGTVTGSVSSVFGRTGDVVAVSGDYDSDQIDNVSSVFGSSVSDALETLSGLIIGGGSGTVTGPESTTNNAIARWLGTDGYTIQNSGIIIDNLDNVTGATSINGVVIESHASRHENGGADEIEIANLSTSETDTSLVLKPDGTGGVEWAISSSLTAPLDPEEDGYIALAQGGDLTYIKGNADEYKLVWDEDSSTWVTDWGSLIDKVSFSYGVVSGGILSINADPTKFDISSGVGYIVNYWDTPEAPQITKVTFGDTAITTTYLATSSVTFVLIDVNGDIVQQTTAPTAEEKRTNIYLGQIGHSDNTVINNVIARPQRAYSIQHNFDDLTDAIGSINIGVMISPIEGTLNISRSDGYMYSSRSNMSNDSKDPNFVYIPSASPLSFRMRTHTGNGAAGVTDVDVANYDVGGVITPLPPGKFQNLRVYQLPSGNTIIQYGQTAYDTLTEATGSIFSEEFILFENLKDAAVLIGVISARSDDTDLTHVGEVQFIGANKFGEPITDANITTLLNTYRGWDGAIVETVEVTVTSNGSVVSFNLQRMGGGSLTPQIDGVYHTLDPSSISLTAGTDTNPILNYVYIQLVGSDPVLMSSTIGFPSEHYCPVGSVLVQSAASVQTDAVYKLHVWTDHIVGSRLGHISHLNYWIRQQSATWVSGAGLTATITSASTPDDVDISIDDGYVLQLHPHYFPSFDTAASDIIYVINDSVTPYRATSNLNSELTDSEGVSMSGRYFSLVIWGVVSENTGDCKIMLNLPSGSYSNSTSLLSDLNGYTNRSIPSVFTGTGFLIAQLNLRHQASGGGTWTLVDTIDLRGVEPRTRITGGTGSTSIFSDTAFRVFDDIDVTKQVAFEVTNISTATTRTITIPDFNVDIVGGPTTSTANAIARYDGTTGQLIKDSSVTIDDSGNINLGTGNIITSGTVDGVDVSTHASRHENGGADEIEISLLGTSETDTDLVLKPDGYGGVEWAISGSNLTAPQDPEEDGYMAVALGGDLIYQKILRTTSVEFVLDEDVNNTSVYFFSWRGSSTDSLINKRSGNTFGIADPGTCSPYQVPFNATIIRAQVTVSGAGVQNASVTYPVSLQTDLFRQDFTTETKIGDIDFSISNLYTVGIYTVDETHFTGSSVLNIDVNEGELLGLKFINGIGASLVGQIRNAFITLILEER